MSGTRILLISFSAALLLVVLSFSQTVSQGRTIFLREGCGNCHSFKGQGGGIGPDLTSVTQKRSTLWIMTQIRNPLAHDVDSRMPEYKHLSLFERYAIIHFLKE